MCRVIEAVGAENEAGLCVRVVACLPLKAERVGLGRGRAASGAVSVKEVTAGDCACFAGALGDVAALVKEVEDAGAGGGSAPGDEAVRAERVDGGERAGAVKLADGVGAVVEEVGLGGVFLLPRPQAVPVVAIGLAAGGVGDQPVLGVEAKRYTFVGRRVAFTSAH